MTMKYFPRLQIYKAKNVTLNPKTLEAYSYRWWKFVAVVENKVIFNNYRYSNTTTKHQYKVRSILNELGIKIDYSLQIPQGIELNSLAELFEIAEEALCNQFLAEEIKREERNAKAKKRRDLKKQQNLALITHASHESQESQIQTLSLIKGEK